MQDSRVQVMIEVALSVALAVVLGWLRPFRMPFGGSIALDMLPIMIVALRRGFLPPKGEPPRDVYREACTLTASLSRAPTPAQS